MRLEVFLFFGRSQRVDISLQAIRRQQLLLRCREVGIDGEMRLDNFGDLLLRERAGGVVRGPILRNYGPVENLSR